MAVELQKLTTQLQSIAQKVGVRDPLTGSLAKKMMDQMSPTELALLFPDYYKEALPDVSGFRGLKPDESFDERAARVEGKEMPSASPVQGGSGSQGGGTGTTGRDTASPASPIAQIFQKYGVKMKGEGKPGQYRPVYNLGENDLHPDVINTIAGEALGKNKESIDAVVNNMFNRIGAQKNWKDLKSVARAKGQYEGYRVASKEEAELIRQRIEAIASGRVPSNVGRATEFRAPNYVFGPGKGKTFERAAREQGYLQPAGNKDNVYAETFAAGPFAPFKTPPPQAEETQTASQMHQFSIKDWKDVPKSVKDKINDEITKYQKPGVEIDFNYDTGEINTSIPEQEFRKMVDEKTPAMYKMFMDPNDYIEYKGSFDVEPQQTTPSAEAVITPDVEKFLEENPQILKDAEKEGVDIADLKQKLADPKMREEIAGEYKLAVQNRKGLSDQKVTISKDVMMGKAPYIEGDDFAVPVYLKKTTSKGFDESVEGMSPEAIQHLKASAIAAKAAGLDKLEVTGALAHTGHKSHSEGTEFDFKGYKDGKMWSKEQRALTVLGAVQQGADRAGFYPGGGVHIGKSGERRPKAAWGPTGTSGVSLGSFTPGLERQVAAYLRGEGPMPDSEVLKQHYAKMAEAKEKKEQQTAQVTPDEIKGTDNHLLFGLPPDQQGNPQTEAPEVKPTVQDPSIPGQQPAPQPEAKTETLPENWKVATNPDGGFKYDLNGNPIAGMASGGEIDTSEVKGIMTDRGMISVNEQPGRAEKMEIVPDRKTYQNLANRLYAGNEARPRETTQNEPDADRVAMENPKAQMQEIPKAKDRRNIQPSQPAHSNEQRSYSPMEDANSPLNYYKTSMKKAIFQATQNPSHGDLFTRIATNGSKNTV